MESDQNTFDQEQTKMALFVIILNIKAKLYIGINKQILPYLFLRKHNPLQG